MEQLEIIIYCPTGQDAKLIASELQKQEINSIAVKDIEELCLVAEKDCGALLIAEEALTNEAINSLNQCFEKQAPWSDIPIIALTTKESKTSKAHSLMLEAFASSGNVTLLERPLRPLVLFSAVKVAIRSRIRQYEVRDLLKEQYQATKMRDEFISIASHELKTPLTSLKLQGQMNKRIIEKSGGAFEISRISKYLDHTIHQVERLNKLVDDMLDVSRLNSGKLELQIKAFDLSELLEEIIDRFLPQLEAVGCQVDMDIGRPIIGNWDPFKIEQVINNLLSNVIRYSPGVPVKVNLVSKESVAILNVQDSGLGIEPKNLQRIFERFERAVPSQSSSGLGLGLYISRQIVELHQGQIKVQSEYGKGSNFIVELPLS